MRKPKSKRVRKKKARPSAQAEFTQRAVVYSSAPLTKEQQALLQAPQPPAPLSSERPLLAQMLKDAEMRAAAAERNYNEVARKLVGLLTPDQKEAARIAGCAEAVYAIEWIELQKERLFPNQATLEQPLDVLKYGRPAQQLT